jgi:hypothetical protein
MKRASLAVGQKNAVDDRSVVDARHARSLFGKRQPVERTQSRIKAGGNVTDGPWN